MARTKKTARMETGGRKPAPPKKTNAPPTKTSKKAKIAPAKAVPAKTAPAKTKGSSKPQGSQPGDSLPSRSVTSGSKRSREEDTSSLNSELLRQLVEANGIIKDLQASIKEKERNGESIVCPSSFLSPPFAPRPVVDLRDLLPCLPFLLSAFAQQPC